MTNRDTTRKARPPGPGEELGDGGKQEAQQDADRTLARRSMWAAVEGLILNKYMLAVAVIALIVAVIFGLTSGVDGDRQSGAIDGSGNEQNQNQGNGDQRNDSPDVCVQVGAGASCRIAIEANLQQLLSSTPSDVDLKKELATRATARPSGAGPWPFLVVDSGIEGLFVRSSGDLEASRLGYVLNRELIWVECFSQTSFTPPTPINDVGPRWLKIKWKIGTPSTLRSTSDPGDPASGWVYAGLTAPYGHDGSVPSCA